MTEALPDLTAMEAFGKRIAARLCVGDVVALNGGLGAGKTTLARSIIAALGHVGEVPSPTFTIIETYDALSPPLVHAAYAVSIACSIAARWRREMMIALSAWGGGAPV